MGPWSDDKFQHDRNLASCLTSNSPHDASHIDLGIPRPSDTCPHTCVILNQNVNGLGKNSDDKLKKIIEMMIDWRIHGYCLQETWQLRTYVKNICGHTIFHRGIDDRPHA